MKPLTGTRIVDLSRWAPGPYGSLVCAALGAEVIKVEWPTTERGRRSGTGSSTPAGVEANLNSAGTFNDANANKLGINLNIRSPEG